MGPPYLARGFANLLERNRPPMRANISKMGAWRFDPVVIVACSAALALYATGVRRYRRMRGRPWSLVRSAWFVLAIVIGFATIESPLDAAGDRAFLPHMYQHLILTDLVAPLALLGGPILLVLGGARTDVARRIVAVLRSRSAHAVTFPGFTFGIFITTLWVLHFSPFFELALRFEWLHVLEHAIYLGTATLFWLPVIAVGPTPWSAGPLAYPLRMLYLIVAMPLEGFLGFAIFSEHHVMYSSYVAAGLGDQQAAGELMWIGGSLAMFVAFMIVGYEWSRAEQRLGERYNARTMPV